MVTVCHSQLFIRFVNIPQRYMLVIHKRHDIGSGARRLSSRKGKAHEKEESRHDRDSSRIPSESLLLRQDDVLAVISKLKFRNSMELERLAAIEREFESGAGVVWIDLVERSDIADRTTRKRDRIVAAATGNRIVPGMRLDIEGIVAGTAGER